MSTYRKIINANPNLSAYRGIINANPNLALDLFQQQKDWLGGYVPCVQDLAWDMLLVQAGTILPPPPRVVAG